MDSDRAITILVVGDHTFDWYAPATARVMREIGLNVCEFDASPFWSPAPLRRVEQRFMIGPAVYRMNRALLKTAYATKPDLIFCYAANFVLPSTISKLGRDFWITGYHNDDPFGIFGQRTYFRHFRASIHHYHSHHVYRQHNISDYLARGVTRVKLLMSGYLPWLHANPNLVPRAGTRRNSIAFIGHFENDNRRDYMRAILAAGLPLRVHGLDAGDWRNFLGQEAYEQLEPIYPVFGEEYVRTLRNTDICLCFFSAGNRDQYTRRVFEIPAAGSFLLAERTPVMQTLYDEGKEAEYFSSPTELVDKCQYYMRNEDLRQRIAEAGHHRCMVSGYDMLSRMRQWWADIKGWMSQGTATLA